MAEPKEQYNIPSQTQVSASRITQAGLELTEIGIGAVIGRTVTDAVMKEQTTGIQGALETAVGIFGMITGQRQNNKHITYLSAGIGVDGIIKFGEQLMT